MSQIVDEIKNRVDIVEFIGRYVNLRKMGNNYVGLCPFHSEKTPSFYVNPDKKFFHCFGCGESGDVITFLMKTESLDFKTAIEKFTQELGIEIVSDDPHYKKKKQLEDVYQYACDFFQKKLQNSNLALKYLEERRISHQSQIDFRLGYNPNDSSLYEHLTKKFSINIINESAILYNTYNVFGGRLIIPICNENGKVVAFSGRALQPNQQAKYINSKETAIFSKQRTLYGFDKAKLYEKNYLIICEGYFDCIRLHQEGLRQTVATMGTNLSDYHIRLIKRLTKKVYLNFDSDEAGLKAMLRNTKILGQLDAYVVILDSQNNQKEDPDSFILKYSVEKYKELLLKSQDYFSFLEQEIIKQNNLTNKNVTNAKPLFVASAINTIKSAIDNIKDPILRSVYYSRQRQIFNLNLSQNFQQKESKPKAQLSKFDFLLSYLLKDFYLINWIEDRESFAQYFHEPLKNVYLKLIQTKEYDFQTFVNSLNEEEAKICYKLYLLNQEQSVSQKRTDFLILINSLEIEKLKRQLQIYLKELAKNPNDTQSKEIYNQTKERLNKLRNA